MSRETLLPALAAHVLRHGLGGLSLRPLAKSANTSDRMLLYHFGSKEQLITALLDHLAMQFTLALDSHFPAERSPSRRACAEAVFEITGQAGFEPFLRVWWDIVAGCAGGNSAYLDAAGRIMDQLMEWVIDHLPEGDPDPLKGARAVLTVIEGAQMLRAIGRDEIAKAGLFALEG
ncbi:TetR/AcrR family transcriptional regulator [Qipengyuania sp. GH38]|nr:TetR/AcrR family transcriptional regulator [Qipengyuania intermedia]